MKDQINLQLDDARRVFDYSPDTGIITWKVRPTNSMQAGQVAGCLDSWGHRQILYRGVSYAGHRLAWFLHYGAWPAAQLDHRDGQRDNNRISNLRPATPLQNACNARRRRDNTSGFKGVCCKGDGWQAYISFAGVRIWLGVFETPHDAAELRGLAADMIHGEFANHG